MTEGEAKGRWCPFARQLVSADSNGPDISGPIALTAANRFNDDKVALCLGSGCMAWRWTAFADDEEHAGNTHGYCGLAGK